MKPRPPLHGAVPRAKGTPPSTRPLPAAAVVGAPAPAVVKGPPQQTDDRCGGSAPSTFRESRKLVAAFRDSRSTSGERIGRSAYVGVKVLAAFSGLPIDLPADFVAKRTLRAR